MRLDDLFNKIMYLIGETINYSFAIINGIMSGVVLAVVAIIIVLALLDYTSTSNDNDLTPATLNRLQANNQIKALTPKKHSGIINPTYPT